MDNLTKPIPSADKITTCLHQLNIYSYWDLLLHIPIRYEDLTQVYKIAMASAGTLALVEGVILSAEIIRKKTAYLEVKLQDETAIITLIFFKYYPNYATQYSIGKTIRAFGEIKLDFSGAKTMLHPKIQTIHASNQNKLSATFSPVYRTVKGLTQTQLIKLVDEALVQLNLAEILPSAIAKQYLSITEALVKLHKLTPLDYHNGVHKQALQRLKLDEMLTLQLIMHNLYNLKRNETSVALKVPQAVVDDFISSLPFQLTNAQQRVIKEIYQDLSSNRQMNRLLQGDVGSGKTIVATIAMLPAVINNYQVCIVAPTEILAEQHYNKLGQFLLALKFNLVWLSGSLTKSEKQSAYDAISSGEAQVVIGTHAIFQEQVKFNNLVLVIVDEQHRFGVQQRLQLQNKALNPHQLMMSATPIPRSLAMSYYADFDLSIIDELPPNRKPIVTKLVNNGRRQEVVNFVQSQLKLGVQIYWVCPLIEESEVQQLANTQDTYTELCNQFPEAAIGLIHGRLKSKEKAAVMQDFLDNRLQILVATTVIEVGVDVANATIMVIEHSERMGLSQLHQLRGRVGRGSRESQCILLYQNPLGMVAKKRLGVIAKYTDGFKIAHQDLLIRGPGELLGNRQSGLPILKFASLDEDVNLIPLSQQYAKTVLANNSDLAMDYAKLWHAAAGLYLKT
jgi:ATP-dependent DNA helicase RecG